MAMVAHDLRNPLFAVSGFTRFLLDAEKNANLSEKQLDMILRINKAGQFMAKLINQMVDFSKIEQGKIALQREENDITALARERIELSEMAARNKDIDLQVNFEEVPRFCFDKTRIEQVIDNLISNAIKYSPGQRHCVGTESRRRPGGIFRPGRGAGNLEGGPEVIIWRVSDAGRKAHWGRRMSWVGPQYRERPGVPAWRYSGG